MPRNTPEGHHETKRGGHIIREVLVLFCRDTYSIIPINHHFFSWMLKDVHFESQIFLFLLLFLFLFLCLSFSFSFCSIMRPGKKTGKKPAPKQQSMGCCGLIMWLLKWGTICFGLFLVMLYCGVFTRMGALKWVETHANEDGNLHLLGITPSAHYGDPWGFELDELKNGELNGKVIIVTGANTGLGFSSVVNLASKGAEVIMACRSKERCNNAVEKARERVKGVEGKGKVVGMLLDLSSFVSIKGFAKEFLGKYERLDSLMLNAGIMWTEFWKTEQGIESQIGVNHFGHYYLTHLLLPILRQTATPAHPTTVVSVSSSAHYRTYDHGVGLTMEQLNDEGAYQPPLAYGQSKLSNILFALELAEREKENNVLVNAIHPGVVETELPRYFVDHLKKKIGSFAVLIEPALNFLSSSVFWDSDTASLTQVYASVGPKILKEKITGKYFHPIARENPPCVKHSNKQELRKGLWALSEQVVQEFENKH